MISLRARVRLAQPWLPFPPAIPRGHRGPARPSAACARCDHAHLERPAPYFVVLAQVGGLWVCEGCLKPEDARPRPPAAGAGPT